MKKILTLILVLCTVSLFSQSETSNSPPRIFFETSLDLSIQSSLEQVSSDFLRPSTNPDVTLFGIKIQQSAKIFITDRWYFSTGIGTMQHVYSQKTRNSFQNFSDHLELDYMPIVPDSIILSKVKFRPSYWTIPLNVGFYLKKQDRFSVFMNVGMEQMFLDKSNVSLRARNKTNDFFDAIFSTSFTLKEHELKEPIEDYYSSQVNNKYMNLNFGLGYEFKINNNCWIGQTARYYQNVKSPNKQLAKARGFSLELRFRYALNRKPSKEND